MGYEVQYLKLSNHENPQITKLLEKFYTLNKQVLVQVDK